MRSLFVQFFAVQSRLITKIARVLLFFTFFVASNRCSLVKSSDDKVKMDIHHRMIVSYIDRGEYSKALSEARIAAKIDRKNENTENLIGLIYSAMAKSRNARKHFKRAVAINSKFWPAWINLGINFIDGKRYRRAIKTLRKIPMDGYDFPERIKFNLGLAYFRLKNYRRALKLFEQSVNENPTYYPALLQVGLVHAAEGRHSKAIYSLQRARKFCGKCQEPLFYLGLSYRHLKKTKKAKTAFAKVVKLAPFTRLAKKARRLGGSTSAEKQL